MKPVIVVLWWIAVLAAVAAPAQKLTVVRVAFAQSEDGTKLAPNYEFLPGETVFFSCQLEGYKRSPADKEESRKVNLGYRVEVKDAHGTLLQAAYWVCRLHCFVGRQGLDAEDPGGYCSSTAGR
jgi:hypothetical protein